MLWIILTIAVAVSCSLCLFFFVLQRSFIDVPAPVTPAHDASAVLEVPDACLCISGRMIDVP